MTCAKELGHNYQILTEKLLGWGELEESFAGQIVPICGCRRRVREMPGVREEIMAKNELFCYINNLFRSADSPECVSVFERASVL